MKHAEKLMERILFLEGRPIVSELNKIMIGDTVLQQLQNDRLAEQGAVEAYNVGVALAARLGDNGSKMLLESILQDEEDHLDLIESQLSMIEQMGLENYLNLQV